MNRPEDLNFETSEILDFSDPNILSTKLKKYMVWNDKWHDGLVQKLCEDVKAGERTFEITANGEIISRLNVVSGGLRYVSGEKEGVVKAKKRVLFNDTGGNEITDRTKEFYEKDDRVIGGKIRVGDQPKESFLREAEEELPKELYKLIEFDNVTVESPRPTEFISPGYPNLKTVTDIHPAQITLNLPDGFDTNQTFSHREEKTLPNGETKITEIEYRFVPVSNS